MPKGSEETGEFSLIKLVSTLLLPEEKKPISLPLSLPVPFPREMDCLGEMVAHLTLPEELPGLKGSTGHKQSLNSAAEGAPLS